MGTEPLPPDLSEVRRHACEVAYVAGLSDHPARSRYLALVAEKRGTAVAERLRKDAWARLEPSA